MARHRPRRLGRALALAAPALWAIAAIVLPVFAQGTGPTAAPTGTAAPGTTSAPPAPTAAPTTESEAETVRPDVEALRRRASRVQALVEGELDPSVEVAALFDVDLDDERAVAVEAERLRKLIAAVEGAGGAAARAAGGRGGEGGQGGGGGAAGRKRAADPALFDARLALDRARLSFYELSPERRSERVESHRARRAESAEAQTKKKLSDAERAQEEAKKEKEQALEQAKRARSKAEKLVNEELARLFDIQGRYAKVEEALIKREQRLEASNEKLLSWTLPADEIIEAPYAERPAPEKIDRVYDELTAHLSETRHALSDALSAVGDPFEIASAESNALESLPVKVDTTKADELRAELLTVERKLRDRHEALDWRRAKQQLEALESLDERRLDLLPLLSPEKRDRLEGLGTAAIDQAGNELRQVELLLRYHLQATRRFVQKVRETGETGDSAIVATITALEWLLPIGLFVWWRRRADETLERWNQAVRDVAKKAKARVPQGLTRAERAVSFLRRVRRPAEWLLLVWAVQWLLPHGAADLLEVKLLSQVLSWTLGGWLVVTAIDALLSDEGRARKTELQTGLLRWQSLRLLGRVVVSIGLFLSLTSSLVGEGTIYGWAVSIAWIVSIVVALVLVRWWRHVIFHHVGVQRKKGPVLRWIERTERGWASFLAAVVGGGYLLGQGAIRLMRHHLGGFDVVKRGLAYWFRREVTRQAEQRGEPEQGGRLDPEVYEALDPENPPAAYVASVADAQVDEVIDRIVAPGGGVFAIVGERGAGKTTLLRRIHERTPDTTIVDCPSNGIAGFRLALREALELAPDASSEEVTALLDDWPDDSALLIDNAHHMVRPVVDGLDEMDHLLALARRSSGTCCWVFAFDSVIWQLLARAREVRPLFDDIIKLTPWSEEGIVRLLASRSEAADIEPDFGAMVTELPEDADEIDQEEALERAQRGYYRLLWDYSLGNPAVSLHFWRASLRPLGENGTYVVRLFEPPDTDDLERLPDSTVFVLRAVVQLDLATVEDVVEATMLDRGKVEDALRYALARRYLESSEEGYRVRWTWYRTITRFLARRHLLTGPYQ